MEWKEIAESATRHLSDYEKCLSCGTDYVDEGDTVRCPKCGLTAIKGGMVIRWGKIRPRMLKCPEYGTIASEDQYQEIEAQ